MPQAAAMATRRLWFMVILPLTSYWSSASIGRPRRSLVAVESDLMVCAVVETTA
jgi:hypothetical protein